jgi:hypothetical protein
MNYRSLDLAVGETYINFAATLTDRKVYPPLAARRPVKRPSSRSPAPIQRRTMALMSHREPLVKKRKAVQAAGPMVKDAQRHLNR